MSVHAQWIGGAHPVQRNQTSRQEQQQYDQALEYINGGHNTFERATRARAMAGILGAVNGKPSHNCVSQQNGSQTYTQCQ